MLYTPHSYLLQLQTAYDGAPADSAAASEDFLRYHPAISYKRTRGLVLPRFGTQQPSFIKIWGPGPGGIGNQKKILFGRAPGEGI